MSLADVRQAFFHEMREQVSSAILEKNFGRLRSADGDFRPGGIEIRGQGSLGDHRVYHTLRVHLADRSVLDLPLPTLGDFEWRSYLSYRFEPRWLDDAIIAVCWTLIPARMLVQRVDGASDRTEIRVYWLVEKIDDGGPDRWVQVPSDDPRVAPEFIGQAVDAGLVFDRLR